MNLKEIKNKLHSRRVCDMACINYGETEIFPYQSFYLDVRTRNEHQPPHFHIISHQEGYDVSVDITGEVIKVNKSRTKGKRSKKPEDYCDVSKMAKAWLGMKPKSKKAKESSNREVFEVEWERCWQLICTNNVEITNES